MEGANEQEDGKGERKIAISRHSRIEDPIDES